MYHYEICIIMYHYVSLCIIMYHYVLLCIIMYYYVLLCLMMSYYVLLCIMYYFMGQSSAMYLHENSIFINTQRTMSLIVEWPQRRCPFWSQNVPKNPNL